MRTLSELRIVSNQKQTAFGGFVDKYLDGKTQKLIIKEEWIMLDELKEKYVAKLQEIEAQDVEVLVQERLKEEEDKIRQEVIAKHNDEILLAKLKVQAVDDMIADQAAELLDCDTEDRENMEV